MRAGYVPPGEVARYKPPGARARDGGADAAPTRQTPADAGVQVRPAERRREAASGAMGGDDAAADGLAAALASVKLEAAPKKEDAASAGGPARGPRAADAQEAASHGGGS